MNPTNNWEQITKIPRKKKKKKKENKLENIIIMEKIYNYLIFLGKCVGITIRSMFQVLCTRVEIVQISQLVGLLIIDARPELQ
jgi:hypothetical protein